MRRVVALVLGLVAALAVVPTPSSATPVAPTGRSSTSATSVTTVHFRVMVGPDRSEECDIIGDLYRPAGATPGHRVPAVMVTNGFGGSKDSDKPLAEFLAAHGYAVLAYSGLGFGGSSCRITLDDPDWDGAAASQLVSFLGGASGVAFRDAAHREPVSPPRYVLIDPRGRDGKRRAHDPRLGMTGASYGGAVQLAAASLDPRIDAIVPIATWHDLAYSLTPNNASATGGPPSRVTGPMKSNIALGLLALTLFSGGSGASTDPFQVSGCPNLRQDVCPGLLVGFVAGGIDGDTRRRLTRMSPAGYLSKVRVPTLLMQGQEDTLFNLAEATATFRYLRRARVPVSMMWLSGGHSGAPAPHDYDLTRPSMQQYPITRLMSWFDHYLKGSDVRTGPVFSYFRPWTKHPRSKDNYATPSGSAATTFRLSSGGSLVSGTGRVRAGSQSLLAGLGLPTSVGPLDVLSQILGTMPDITIPGTAAHWSSPALTRPLDVVGAPEVSLRFQHVGLGDFPSAPGVPLFVKLWDVDTTGHRSLVHQQVAAAVLTDPDAPLSITMSPIVHRFQRGHRVQLEVAGGDANYRGAVVPTILTVATGRTAQTLRLPTPTSTPVSGR